MGSKICRFRITTSVLEQGIPVKCERSANQKSLHDNGYPKAYRKSHDDVAALYKYPVLEYHDVEVDDGDFYKSDSRDPKYGLCNVELPNRSAHSSSIVVLYEYLSESFEFFWLQTVYVST